MEHVALLFEGIRSQWLTPVCGSMGGGGGVHLRCRVHPSCITRIVVSRTHLLSRQNNFVLYERTIWVITSTP